jgi:hypothetical protein
VTLPSTLKRAVPRPLVPAAKQFYYKLFRLQLRMRFWLADLRIRERPMPPAILRFRVSESVSIGEFLRIGEGCARLIRENAADMGLILRNLTACWTSVRMRPNHPVVSHRWGQCRVSRR